MTTETSALLTYEDALDKVLAAARPTRTESVPLSRLVGRTLVEPLASRCDLPPFDSSAVDGYAIRGQDIPSLDAEFELIGESRAGQASLPELQALTAVRVFTGAPLPLGTGAVVMQEDAVQEASSVSFAGKVLPGDHVRTRGEELAVGERAIEAGLISPATVAAIAACGYDQAEVWSTPKVGILATGDELADPGADLQFGQVYESNSFALSAAVNALGLEAPKLIRCADDARATRHALAELLETCDVVLTSGGVSVGDYDVVRPTLDALGVEQIFWGVAVKPGKPLFFGRRDEAFVFGLPGNPVSALTTYLLFVRPFLLAKVGREDRPMSDSVLLGGLKKKPGRTEFVPGRMTDRGVDPLIGRGSHKSTILAEADALVMFPLEAERLRQGENVRIKPIRWGWEA